MRVIHLVFLLFVFACASQSQSDKAEIKTETSDDFWENFIDKKAENTNDDELSSSDDSHDREVEEFFMNDDKEKKKRIVSESEEEKRNMEFLPDEDEDEYFTEGFEEQIKEDYEDEKKEDDEKDSQKKKEKIKFFNYPNQEHYYMEIGFGVIIIVYLILFVLGSEKNKTIAETWRKFASPFFIENFSRSHKRGTYISKQSGKDYFFYTSGRKNFEGCLSSLELAPRFDIIKYVLGFLMGTNRDVFILDIGIQRKLMKPFVAVVRQKDKLQKYITNHSDLSFAPKDLEFSFGKMDNYRCVTDAPNMLKSLLKNSVMEKFYKNKESFLGLHITDFATDLYPNVKTCLRFEIDISGIIGKEQNEVAHRMIELMKLAFSIADDITVKKMPGREKEENEKKRRKVIEKIKQEKIKQYKEQRKKEIEEKKKMKEKKK